MPSVPSPARPARERLPALRSLLFLPATATQLMPKAASRGADALIIDLEDGVAPDRKAQARALVVAALDTLAPSGLPVLLRINASQDMARQDLDAVPLDRFAGVLLPKVETPAQIDWLAQAMAVRCPVLPPIAALIESPLGVLATREIAAHPALAALGFGAEDYASALGVAPDAVALAWPAQMVLTGAHAHGLQCWGLPASIAQIENMAAFGADVDLARRIGFTGTVCIHPRQVPVANAGFSPSAQELAWAERVLAADEQARAAGQGAVQLDGRMIDAPIVERARRLLARARPAS